MSIHYYFLRAVAVQDKTINEAIKCGKTKLLDDWTTNQSEVTCPDCLAILGATVFEQPKALIRWQVTPENNCPTDIFADSVYINHGVLIFEKNNEIFVAYGAGKWEKVKLIDDRNF